MCFTFYAAHGTMPYAFRKLLGGCGNGNQSCMIAKYSLIHGEIEYCYEC